MLTKFCNAPGCHSLCEVGQRYCTKHQAAADAFIAKHSKEYDKTVRQGKDKQYTDFYHSTSWERKRLYIMAKYYGLDIYLYYTKHITVPAQAIHHIAPLREAWEQRYSDGNLIPLSAETHAEIEQIYKTPQRAEMQRKLKRMLANWEAEHVGRGGKNV